MVKVQRLFAKTNLKIPVYRTRSRQGFRASTPNKSTSETRRSLRSEVPDGPSSTRGQEPSASVGGFCFAGALRDGVVYSAWFNNSEVVEETNMEDNKSMNVKKTVKSGITFGSALAMVISYTTWKSVGWAIFHGLLSWVYVIYFLLRY